MNKKLTAKSLKAIHKTLIQKANHILFTTVSIYKKWQNKYYQKHKVRHQNEARERYQNSSEEE